jgi:hypothetical protein
LLQQISRQAVYIHPKTLAVQGFQLGVLRGSRLTT